MSRPTPLNSYCQHSVPTVQDSKIPESWLSHQIVRHASSGKASQRNTPRSRAHEQIINAVCLQTRPALACACTVAKSSDSSGLPCLGVRTNKCLLSLICRQELVGVSISNVTASLTELFVRGDVSHSFGAFQTSPETHHRVSWDGSSN